MSEVQKKETLLGFLESQKERFQDALVDNRIDFSREIHFAAQAFEKNAYLLKAARENKTSVKNAIVNVSATGLTLNPIRQLAYLVPRRINKQISVVLEISYRGLIWSATESGSILWAQAEVVHKNDDFVIHGPDKAPEHKRNPFSDRGKIVGCYCVAKTPGGDFLTTAMSIEEVYSIRDRSDAYKSGFGAWVTDEGEMIKKTVVKRAAKMWPRTPQIQRLEKAIDVDNETNGIDFQAERKEIERRRAEIEADFPRKEEDREFGLNYLFAWGKFRGKRIRECDEREMLAYLEHLRDKLDKDKRYQVGDKFETYEALEDFFENKDSYYAELDKEFYQPGV